MVQSIQEFLMGAGWSGLASAIPTLAIILHSLVTLVLLLVAIAFLLLMDRKVWAAVQLRKGPNVVGPWGLMQSFADLLKFVFKEVIIPSGSNKFIFVIAPAITASLALAGWAIIPIAEGWGVADLNVGILFALAISSLGVYGVIMGGWASNSKYAFLGALRSTAQMVSYELSIGFVLVAILLVTGTLNLTEIVHAQDGKYGMFSWHWFMLFPMFIIFFISALAETNRPPFDLPEAESELVAGFMIEYSSTPYLLYMLGEYVAITFMCSLTTILFLGGWLPPFDIAPLNWIPGFVWFILKVVFVFFMFALVKTVVPRYRYDQLMRLGWKVLIPISLGVVVFISSFMFFFDMYPGA